MLNGLRRFWRLLLTGLGILGCSRRQPGIGMQDALQPQRFPGAFTVDSRLVGFGRAGQITDHFLLLLTFDLLVDITVLIDGRILIKADVTCSAVMRLLGIVVHIRHEHVHIAPIDGRFLIHLHDSDSRFAEGTGAMHFSRFSIRPFLQITETDKRLSLFLPGIYPHFHFRQFLEQHSGEYHP